MPEEIPFSTESNRSRADVAALVGDVANSLDDDGELTLAGGGDSPTLAVPPAAEFEVTAERETGDGAPELGVEFELEWDEATDGAGGSDEVRVE
ncbi:amphi-Trp domain-containing protein [Candidatus Halobonum tyrrellensis]|uniref:Amphi-Trp domain-containing protein n=1 Tax=Candidatus Halobonum tyrrellensis G22 TaxID=1324957 RepID=V4GTP0_9EURY|nr:amphi-Trp domain-containing protein [Candidatus Halobonum tyrrellensis]ESP88481.1 hypothetical protein K933_08477 [Candidatus Halobonum tyrrellensis G22]